MTCPYFRTNETVRARVFPQRGYVYQVSLPTVFVITPVDYPDRFAPLPVASLSTSTHVHDANLTLYHTVRTRSKSTWSAISRLQRYQQIPIYISCSVSSTMSLYSLPTELLEEICHAVDDICKTTRQRKDTFYALKNSSALFSRIDLVDKALFREVHVSVTPASKNSLQGIASRPRIRNYVRKVTFQRPALSDPESVRHHIMLDERVSNLNHPAGSRLQPRLCHPHRLPVFMCFSRRHRVSIMNQNSLTDM